MRETEGFTLTGEVVSSFVGLLFVGDRGGFSGRSVEVEEGAGCGVGYWFEIEKNVFKLDSSLMSTLHKTWKSLLLLTQQTVAVDSALQVDSYSPTNENPHPVSKIPPYQNPRQSHNPLTCANFAPDPANSVNFGTSFKAFTSASNSAFLFRSSSTSFNNSSLVGFSSALVSANVSSAASRTSLLI